MTYGPNPWQQAHWDWRAAGNFMCGGAGGGLIVCAALSGLQGRELALHLLAGVALIGTGLGCVWLEIGRPLRALNVYFNPRTSWMSREAIVAALLMPATLAAAVGWPGLQWLAAALALAFVFCQSRMLNAARGIPAWREPLLQPLVLLTGLAEGAGLLLLLRPTQAATDLPLLAAVGMVLLARAATWLAYRRRLAPRAARRALVALDAAGRWLVVAGTLLPLLLLSVPLLGIAGGAAGARVPALLLALAGALAAAAGAWFKLTLITRASFNQGFALVHLPVRGAPR